MKTYLQIAEEIGVSKQAVYKRVKGKLYTEVHTYIHTKNGVTYISEQGEIIIKQDFLNDSISIGAHTERIQDTLSDIVGAHTEYTPSNSIYDEFLKNLQEENAFLRAQNKTLNDELNQERQHSRRQADRISDLATEIAKLANNAQTVHAMQNATLLETGKEKDTDSTEAEPIEPVSDFVAPHYSTTSKHHGAEMAGEEPPDLINPNPADNEFDLFREYRERNTKRKGFFSRLFSRGDED